MPKRRHALLFFEPPFSICRRFSLLMLLDAALIHAALLPADTPAAAERRHACQLMPQYFAAAAAAAAIRQLTPHCFDSRHAAICRRRRIYYASLMPPIRQHIDCATLLTMPLLMIHYFSLIFRRAMPLMPPLIAPLLIAPHDVDATLPPCRRHIMRDSALLTLFDVRRARIMPPDARADA